MKTEEFWKCIDMIDSEAVRFGDEEGGLEPLIGHLEQLSEEQLKGFDDRLAEVLYALDTLEHYKHTAAAEGMTAGDDGFLYARCWVVSQGRDYYESVLKDPTKMPPTFEEWCESLLYVTQFAWENSGRDGEWTYDAPVSYETGQNTKCWPSEEA